MINSSQNGLGLGGLFIKVNPEAHNKVSGS
uniref:Uncharacterized protein n=1 Tax=Argulus foliaceus TaxID=509924 RepID=A0A7R9NLZ1_9CRUS